MSYQDLIPLSNFSQSSVALIGFLAYLPQWITLYRTKSSQNISLYSWVLWSLSTIFALFYAIVQFKVYNTGTVLVFTSTASFLFVVVTLTMVFLYRQKSHRVDDGKAIISAEELSDQVVETVVSATQTIEQISRPAEEQIEGAGYDHSLLKEIEEKNKDRATKSFHSLT